MANSFEPVRACASPSAPERACARVAVFTHVEDARGDWAALEADGAGSAYQTRAFVLPWLRFMSDGARPLITIGYDAADRPAVLLPLVAVRRGPVTLGVFAGGRECNLSAPLRRPGFCESPATARALLRAAARAAPVDVFVLRNQPAVWNGAPNGFARLAPHAAPSDAYGATFGADADAFLQRTQSKNARKKLKAKAAKLAEQGAVTVERAQDPNRARTLLASFVDQKTHRFAARGKDAGVAGVAARAFLDALATDRAGGAPALDLYALCVDDRIVATYGGLAFKTHWHGLFNSIAIADAIVRCSPGDLLLRAILPDLAARGLRSFDLGIGEARYKTAICDERMALWDTFQPASVAGRLWAPLEIARRGLKRRIKHTPWALAFVERMRAGQA